jgi:hypothetical protein
MPYLGRYSSLADSDHGVLVLYPSESKLTFQMNVSSPYSGLKNQISKKTESKQASSRPNRLREA